MENNLEMNRAEASYMVDVRSEKIVKEKGSIQNAISYLKSELTACNNLWSEYSCDCLGHAITCNRLMIGWLERKLKHSH